MKEYEVQLPSDSDISNRVVSDYPDRAYTRNPARLTYPLCSFVSSVTSNLLEAAQAHNLYQEKE